MNRFVAFSALASFAMSPLQAANRDAFFVSSGDPSSARTSMFIGAGIRIGLDQRTRTLTSRPALRLGGMAFVPETGRIGFADGLELRGGPSGKAAVFLGGHDIQQLGRKAELSGSGKAILIGGAVLLAIGGVIVLSRIEDGDCVGERGDCD